MRWCLLVLAFLTSVASADRGVKIWQASDPAITEGETVLDGDPAALYAACTSYVKWAEIFPDVQKVIVSDRKGADAKVTLVAPSGHRDNLQFHATPAARMIYFEDTGNSHAEIWGEIVLAPGDVEHTTKLHIRLFAKAKGVARLVVDGDAVKKTREQKLERQLSHVKGYFARVASKR